MDTVSRGKRALAHVADTELCEVFVSHRARTQDVAFAEALTHALRQRGINCFLDLENIDCGESFAHRILDGIKRSQLVVVLFNDDISTWIHFEASCAYFDKKLFPVSLNGASVPLPYGRIHYHEIHYDPESDTVDEEAVDRLVDAIQYKLDGASEHVARTRAYRLLNRFFFSGFTILFAIASAVILFGWGDIVEHANHLHVTLGAAIIGGQFFLSLGFARMVSYPSARQRESGFENMERLYYIWAVIAVAQPLLGVWLAYHLAGGGNNDDGLLAVMLGFQGWIWASLVLYCMAILCTWVGYSMARGAIQLDSATDAPYKINKHFFWANVLFLLGFVFMVAVLNLMIAEPAIKAI